MSEQHLEQPDDAPLALEAEYLHLRRLRPLPPSWVYRLLEDSHASALLPEAATDKIAAIECGRLALLTASVAGVSDLSANQFILAVEEAYRSLARELRHLDRHAVRLWNFIPDIHLPIETIGDRYQAFNAGRLAGYSEWFRPTRTLPTAVATSSAVGIDGDTFWVYVLAADIPGEPIENPRQIPSYRYSSRYGARPPCFARATRFGSLLLIGGTASILGEDSCHYGDVEAQTHETIRNIASLLTASSRHRSPLDPLDALRDARVHVVNGEQASVVEAVLRELLPHLQQCEFVQADLCRSDLLVEIEATAQCP